MERQTLAVGVADLLNFARAVDAVGSDGEVDLLQAAYQAAGDVILQHGGQIRKYLGDAILFTFTDPRQAISAAHEIVAGYRFAVGSLTLRYRVAIVTGEVLVGQIGHPSYLVEDILGITVNRVFRLLPEASRSASGVALCDETWKYI
ncbi:MAG: adenylate/guanylate cyclase domain-containing protein [Chloroflexi bacterium]|nr:adenylate/guanylate cyclase domain-containing protein [Chloroflexota bacterium]